MVGSEGPVVFWKGLKMSQKCPGCPKGAHVGLGCPGAIQKVWGCPREALEGTGGPPVDPWGPWIHPEGSGDVQEGPCRVQGVPRCVQGILAVIQKGLGMSQDCLGVSRECSCGSGGPVAIQKGLEMSQRGLGGPGGSLGGFCCLLEGSEDVPGVSWGVQGVLVWVWGVLEPSRRVWGCPREDWKGLGSPYMGSEGPVVFWKGLKMSQKCLGVSRGCCH